MTDSNPIQDIDTNETEPETSQTNNANVEEENDLIKFDNELDNLGNEDNSNDVSDDNSASNLMNSKDDVSDNNLASILMVNREDYSMLIEPNETEQPTDTNDEPDQPFFANESKTALDQLDTSENEIDQPTEQPTDTSINKNEPINTDVTNTGVYMTESESNQFTNTGVNMTEPDQLHAIMDESRNFTEEEIYEEPEIEETSQPTVYTKTETIQQVTKELDDDSKEAVNDPELIQKEIYERKIETIWPVSNVYNNEIEDDDEDDDEEDEVEEIKMIRIKDTKQRIRRRPIRQQHQDLSPPFNNFNNFDNFDSIADTTTDTTTNTTNTTNATYTTYTTSSNVHSNVPNAKKYSLSYFVKIFTVLSLILLFFYSQLGKQPSFLRNFADTTNTIFKGIDSVELPDVNTINNHTITVRRASFTFDRSPIFKSYGRQVSTGLRDLGDTIREAGQLLRHVYSKGSSVYTSFSVEIEAIVRMLDRNDIHSLQGDDADYIKLRLTRLSEKLKDFRQSVEKVHSYIINAEKIKLDNEGNIVNGFREAEKYKDNAKYSDVISKAKNDLEPLDGIFNHLRDTADQLEKLRIMLKEYEDRLIGVANELGGDEAVKVTKSDLKYLQRVIDHSKVSHNKFDKYALLE